MSGDFTDADAIRAGRMVADGASWEEVVSELYPGTEYPELLASLTCHRFLWWYWSQTPKRLKEVFRDE